MENESSENQYEEIDNYDIWGEIKQKLEEKGQTVDWLSEQVSQGKKSFYWHYSRKRIKTDMLFEISNILKRNFFEYYSKSIEKFLLSKKQAP